MAAWCLPVVVKVVFGLGSDEIPEVPDVSGPSAPVPVFVGIDRVVDNLLVGQGRMKGCAAILVFVVNVGSLVQQVLAGFVIP